MTENSEHLMLLIYLTIFNVEKGLKMLTIFQEIGHMFLQAH